MFNDKLITLFKKYHFTVCKYKVVCSQEKNTFITALVYNICIWLNFGCLSFRIDQFAALHLHNIVNVSRSVEVIKKFVINGSKLSCINFCKLLERTYNFRDSLSIAMSWGKTNVVLSCATNSTNKNYGWFYHNFMLNNEFIKQSNDL